MTRRREANLWRHLRQPKRRSKHRAQAKSAGFGKIPNRVGIEHCPAEVDDRLLIGHWECGTVIHGHKPSGLITLVESRSGYLLGCPSSQELGGADASGHDPPAEASPGAVQAITQDNGSKFAGHEAVAKAVTAATYSCDPYCSGQHGD